MTVDHCQFERINSRFMWNMPLPVTHGLVYGKAGLLLLYYSLYQISNKERYLEQIHIQINETLASFGKEDTIISYYAANYSYGMTGFCSVVDYFIQQDLIKDKGISGSLATLNEIIHDQTLTLLKNSKYSFFHGATGAIAYLTSLSKKNVYKKKKQLLNLVFKSVKHENLTDLFVKANGEINYSAPYGLTGFLLVLLNLEDNTLFSEHLKSGSVLLRNSTQQLLQAKGDNLFVETLSWSSGNLMQSVALCKYGKDFNCKSSMESGITLAIRLHQRAENQLLSTNDLSIGTGLSGIMEIYSSLYTLTEDDRFKEIRDQIYKQILSGINQTQWWPNRENTALFKSITGTALCLFSQEPVVNRSWRKLFLLP